MVIKRAAWPAPPRTAGALLKAFTGTDAMDEGALDRLSEAQAADEPPENPWRDE